MEGAVIIRQAKQPRPKEDYRCFRRNRSILGRDGRNWYGVEAKPSSKQYPTLAIKTSQRGETHYVELPW